jgi:membrane protein
MNLLQSRLRSLDRYQRTHAVLGLPLAVIKKYSDDQAGYLAAGITYYAFFSLFPLLLVFVSSLGFVLHSDPSLERSVVHSAIAQFPIVGPQLKTHSLRGSGLGLVLGAVGSLWAGLGVCQAAQNAIDQLWGVPHDRRPGFLQARIRALLLLVVLGGGVLLGTASAWLGTVGTSIGPAWKIVAIILSTCVNVAVFWLAFRTLTTRAQSWRSLRGGAIAAGVGYEALQLAGGYYVGHVLRTASNTYGTFALVIGLLSWIYLAVHVTLLAVEGNVVATRRLWPRSLSTGPQEPLTDADRRSLRQRALVEQRHPAERIDVSYSSDEPTAPER